MTDRAAFERLIAAAGRRHRPRRGGATNRATLEALLASARLHPDRGAGSQGQGTAWAALMADAVRRHEP